MTTKEILELQIQLKEAPTPHLDRAIKKAEECLVGSRKVSVKCLMRAEDWRGVYRGGIK